jgi:hypothetical protein
VSGFGATTESKANQLLQMVAAKGADGEPLMTTRAFRAAWPDQSTYPEAEDPVEIRERRAKTINARIRKIASDLEQQMGDQASQPQMLLMMHQAISQEFPVQADDDPMAHFNTLSSITQDEDESPTAKQLAKWRQGVYGNWLVMLGMMPPPFVPFEDPMALMGQAQQGAPAPMGGAPQQQMAEPGPSGPTPQMDEGTQVGGTTTAESLSPTPGEVSALTQEAGA